MEQVQTNLLFTEQLVIGFLFAAGVALLLKGLTIGIAYAKTKAELIKDEKVRKIVLSTLDSVDSLVMKNITNAETTLKPAILQSIADGKVDKSELDSLSVIVRDNVLKQLSTDSTNVLNESIGDVNSYLATTIEDTLAKMKADESNTIVTKTVIPESNLVATTIAADSDVVENKDIDVSAVVAENEQLKATLASIQSVAAGTIL